MCSIEGLPPGSPCALDGDCRDYCELGACRAGNSGDPCQKNFECKGDLTCQGLPGLGSTCTAKKPEGGACGDDSDCIGYCQNARCWDGSSGDDCGKDNDCKGSLTCVGAGFLAKCRALKSEGGACGDDDDCIGYCENFKCWDGSHGDQCGSSRDCQGNLKCKRREKCHKPCRICPQACVPADLFRTCR